MISKGDVPPQITDTYNGDFNTIKNNLNTLVTAMNEITAAADEIANGNLTVEIRERSAQDKLMQALGSMVSGLTQTVSDIRSIAGFEGRERAGGCGRRSLVVDGGDGLQHQAECR
jgi:methyl-accepting chemotaxis protein